MSTSTKLTVLIEDLERNSFKYPVGHFPIRHKGDGIFETFNHVTFKFTIDGAGYLSERNTRYRYAQFTALVREERWDDLEKLANEAIIPIKGAGRNLIFALMNGNLVGLLRHYNYIDHAAIIKVIDEARLSSSISGWNITPQYMTVDVTMRTKAVRDEDEALVIALRILNGHSGHHALQYQLLIKSKGFEYTAPLYGRSRHLSKVSQMFDQLQDAVRRVQETKLDYLLLHKTAIRFLDDLRRLVPTMTVRQESLLHLIESSDMETGLDVFCLLGQYATTKGYNSAVMGLLTPLVEELSGWVTE